jgi:phage terminase Nu1 subunit (DNA packaging protein)
MTKDDIQTATAAQLAAMFGISERSVYNLAKKGVLQKHGRGFALVESVRLYIAHIRGRDQNQSTIDTLRIEQSKLASARRAVIERDVIPVAAIEVAWDRILRTVRSAVLAIPGRARFALPHLSASDAETIAGICRDQLTTASMTDTPPAIDESA